MREKTLGVTVYCGCVCVCDGCIHCVYMSVQYRKQLKQNVQIETQEKQTVNHDSINGLQQGSCSEQAVVKDERGGLASYWNGKT